MHKEPSFGNESLRGEETLGRQTNQRRSLQCVQSFQCKAMFPTLQKDKDNISSLRRTIFSSQGMKLCIVSELAYDKKPASYSHIWSLSGFCSYHEVICRRLTPRTFCQIDLTFHRYLRPWMSRYSVTLRYVTLSYVTLFMLEPFSIECRKTITKT